MSVVTRRKAKVKEILVEGPSGAPLCFISWPGHSGFALQFLYNVRIVHVFTGLYCTSKKL